MKKAIIVLLFLAGAFIFTTPTLASDEANPTYIEVDSSSVISVDLSDLGEDGQTITINEDSASVITSIGDMVYLSVESLTEEQTFLITVCEGDDCWEEEITISFEEENMEDVDNESHIHLTIDGDELMITPEDDGMLEITEEPLYGEASLEDGVLTYTASGDFTGTDEVTVEICEDDICIIHELEIEVEAGMVVTVTVKQAGGAAGKRSIQPPICGDSKVNSMKEQCDDGNYKNGDGCSRTCKLESNMTKKIVINRKSLRTASLGIIVNTSEVAFTPMIKKVTTSHQFDTAVSATLKGNNKVFFDIVIKAIAKRTHANQIDTMKKLRDGFPQYAYAKFKLNKTILHKALNARINLFAELQ